MSASTGNGPDLRRTIDAVWRIEAPRLIAGLTRMVRDVGLAEDLAQDALVVALEKWPQSGVPDNPGAWLMATAKHRAIDLFRRGETLQEKQEQIAHRLEQDLADDASADPTADAAAAAQVGDDLLGLIFMCCHPVLAIEARVALTLRLLGGPDDGRDRARVPDAESDRAAADRAREENARGRAECRSRCPPATSWPSGCRRCWA